MDWPATSATLLYLAEILTDFDEVSYIVAESIKKRYAIRVCTFEILNMADDVVRHIENRFLATARY